MKILQIDGANGETLRSFICREDEQAPSASVWQAFVAQYWQKDPSSLEAAIVERFPMLQPIEHTSACCFGPPFFDENGNPMNDFEFPRYALLEADGNGNPHIKYKDGNVVWMIPRFDFTYIIQSGNKQFDLDGLEVERYHSLRETETQFGIIAFKADLPITRLPEIKILPANKAFPAIIHTSRWEERFYGYVFYQDKWEKVSKMSDTAIVFKELHRLQLY